MKAEEVKMSIKEDPFCLFRAPKNVFNDNTNCSAFQPLLHFVTSSIPKCLTVLSYVPISNEKAEKMVETIKHAIGCVATQAEEQWDKGLIVSCLDTHGAHCDLYSLLFSFCTV